MSLSSSRHQAQAVPVEGTLELIFGTDEPDRDPAEVYHELHPEVLTDLIDPIRPYAHMKRPIPFRFFWETLRMNRLRDSAGGLPNPHQKWYSRRVMADVDGWSDIFRTVGE